MCGPPNTDCTAAATATQLIVKGTFLHVIDVDPCSPCRRAKSAPPKWLLPGGGSAGGGGSGTRHLPAGRSTFASSPAAPGSSTAVAATMADAAGPENRQQLGYQAAATAATTMRKRFGRAPIDRCMADRDHAEATLSSSACIVEPTLVPQEETSSPSGFSGVYPSTEDVTPSPKKSRRPCKHKRDRYRRLVEFLVEESLVRGTTFCLNDYRHMMPNSVRCSEEAMAQLAATVVKHTPQPSLGEQQPTDGSSDAFVPAPPPAVVLVNPLPRIVSL